MTTWTRFASQSQSGTADPMGVPSVTRPRACQEESQRLRARRQPRRLNLRRRPPVAERRRMDKLTCARSGKERPWRRVKDVVHEEGALSDPPARMLELPRSDDERI